MLAQEVEAIYSWSDHMLSNAEDTSTLNVQGLQVVLAGLNCRESPEQL